MALRIEDLQPGLSDLRDELAKTMRHAGEAERHLSDADFQSTCNVLGHLAGPLGEVEALRRELLKRFEQGGFTPGRKLA